MNAKNKHLTAHTTDGMNHKFPVQVESLSQPLDELIKAVKKGQRMAIKDGKLESYPHWDPPFFIYGARSVTHVTDQDGTRVL